MVAGGGCGANEEDIGWEKRVGGRWAAYSNAERRSDVGDAYSGWCAKSNPPLPPAAGVPCEEIGVVIPPACMARVEIDERSIGCTVTWAPVLGCDEEDARSGSGCTGMDAIGLAESLSGLGGKEEAVPDGDD